MYPLYSARMARAGAVIGKCLYPHDVLGGSEAIPWQKFLLHTKGQVCPACGSELTWFMGTLPNRFTSLCSTAFPTVLTHV